MVLDLFFVNSSPNISENVYGVHPFYMELRNNRAHGAVSRIYINTSIMSVVFVEFEWHGCICPPRRFDLQGHWWYFGFICVRWTDAR
jgi:hypothetical protein